MLSANNQYLHKYAINNNKYLDIILGLRNMLPIELVHIIAFIYVELFKCGYLHVIYNDLVFQTQNRTYYFNYNHDDANLSMISPILKRIRLEDITHIYSFQYTKMHLDYNIITTRELSHEIINEKCPVLNNKRVYMIINGNLSLLNIKGFITASVSLYHNMILTTNGVLATGSNKYGQSGLTSDINKAYLSPVNINNVDSITCNKSKSP